MPRITAALLNRVNFPICSVKTACATYSHAIFAILVCAHPRFTRFYHRPHDPSSRPVQARSEAVTNMQARFSFNSKAAQETYAEAWDKRDPWRMIKKNVSFAAPRPGTKVRVVLLLACSRPTRCMRTQRNTKRKRSNCRGGKNGLVPFRGFTLSRK